MGRPRAFDHDEAKRLRATGMTYRAIGELLGVTDQSVRVACNPDVRKYYSDMQKKLRYYHKPCPQCAKPMSRYNAKGLCRSCWGISKRGPIRPDMLRCSLCRLWLPDEEFSVSRQNVARRERSGECKRCAALRRRDERQWQARQRAIQQDQYESGAYV